MKFSYRPKDERARCVQKNRTNILFRTDRANDVIGCLLYGFQFIFCLILRCFRLFVFGVFNVVILTTVVLLWEQLYTNEQQCFSTFYYSVIVLFYLLLLINTNIFPPKLSENCDRQRALRLVSSQWNFARAEFCVRIFLRDDMFGNIQSGGQRLSGFFHFSIWRPQQPIVTR